MSTDSTERTEQTAAEWLVRRHSGHWSQADQADLDRWFEESAANAVAYLRLELGWEESARLRAIVDPERPNIPPLAAELNLGPIFDTPAAAAPAEPLAPSVPARRRTAVLLRVAAVIVLAVATSIGVWTAYSSLSSQRYSTPVGRILSVPIADGSKVTLNTDSRIRVTLAGDERRVDLEEGEAFFQVARDPARPFVVAAGSKRIVAVGTAFSVRRVAEDVEVAVMEGSVRVEDVASNEVHTPSSIAAADVLLSPGHIAHASNVGVMVQTKTLPEIEQQLSWRSGILMFRNSTLAAAAAEFNRYNVQQLIIEDPAISSLPVEGNFRATSVADFAHLLEKGYPVALTEQPDRIVLRAR